MVAVGGIAHIVVGTRINIRAEPALTASPNRNVTPQPGTPSQIAGSVLPLQKAEELLATLSDVVSARIVADGSGGVEAIHLLVMGELSPKQIVRNVESALMAQFGMRVDHRKISVAATSKRPTPAEGSVQGQPAEAAASEPAAGRAVYFEDVEIRGSRAQGVTCKVTLRRGPDRFVGEAEGQESDRSRVELSARATLAAIALSEGADRTLTLEGVKLIDAFERELVLVGVLVRHGRGNMLLSGSCEIKDSAETASALAVLNATNRWVEGMK